MGGKVKSLFEALLTLSPKIFKKKKKNSDRRKKGERRKHCRNSPYLFPNSKISPKFLTTFQHFVNHNSCLNTHLLRWFEEVGQNKNWPYTCVIFQAYSRHISGTRVLFIRQEYLPLPSYFIVQELPPPGLWVCSNVPSPRSMWQAFTWTLQMLAPQTSLTSYQLVYIGLSMFLDVHSLVHIPSTKCCSHVWQFLLFCLPCKWYSMVINVKCSGMVRKETVLGHLV